MPAGKRREFQKRYLLWAEQRRELSQHALHGRVKGQSTENVPNTGGGRGTVSSTTSYTGEKENRVSAAMPWEGGKMERVSASIPNLDGR